MVMLQMLTVISLTVILLASVEVSLQVDSVAKRAMSMTRREEGQRQQRGRDGCKGVQMQKDVQCCMLYSQGKVRTKDVLRFEVQTEGPDCSIQAIMQRRAETPHTVILPGLVVASERGAVIARQVKREIRGIIKPSKNLSQLSSATATHLYTKKAVKCADPRDRKVKRLLRKLLQRQRTKAHRTMWLQPYDNLPVMTEIVKYAAQAGPMSTQLTAFQQGFNRTKVAVHCLVNSEAK
ncbi:hypothetical protein D4764_07G0006090 [Takifugu flavidus]|uniref:Chemokine interleukin-8-like domain-containing protein n=1 Tax=Takifugu flavidus TaxID=433684 RepID=A0A5C6MWI7_9TELE|nr:hypothetical protein D4764_07G0006090 [Takifugu flavidus]